MKPYEDKAFALVVGIWLVFAALGIAFWGFILWLAYRLVTGLVG